MRSQRVGNQHVIAKWQPLILIALVPCAHAVEVNDSWDVTLGAGVASFPKFPGSDTTQIQPVPIVSVKYKQFFIGGGAGDGQGGFGVNLFEDSHWRLGAIGSFGLFKPRKESDDPHLRGLGDINSSPRAGGFVSFRADWFAVSLSASSDVGGKHHGTVANLAFTGHYQLSERVTLSAGPGVAWTDARYTQTVFGVDAVQSSRSGLPQFTAGSGINSIRFSVGANYLLDSHWSVGTQLSQARLQGSAADSPITEKRNQTVLAAFAAYHF